MHQNPLIAHYRKVEDGPRKISDFLSLDEWRSTAIYQKYYKQAGGEHQIAVVLPLEAPTLVAFAFNRVETDFSERERAILTKLQPHLTQAYKNAKLFGRTKGRLTRREQMLDAIGASWIDLDADLKITTASSAARANVSTFFPEFENHSIRLPETIEAWVDANLLDVRSGKPTAPLIHTNSAGRLTLRLLAMGDTAECSVVAERFLDATSSRPLEGLGLTRRQAEILYWIAQGKSNAEIAVLLKISVRTVENHVSRIFELLKVNNRTEAANAAVTQLHGRG